MNFLYSTPVFHVTDLMRSVEWYKRILQCSVAGYSHHKGRRVLCYLDCGRVTINLYEVPSGDPRPSRPSQLSVDDDSGERLYLADVFFFVQDLAAVASRIPKETVLAARASEYMPMLVIEDPDHWRIGTIEEPK